MGHPRNFSSPTKVFSTKNQLFTFGHSKGKIPLGGVNGPPSGGVGPPNGGSGPLKMVDHLKECLFTTTHMRATILGTL
jgi:hypothetical protein